METCDAADPLKQLKAEENAVVIFKWRVQIGALPIRILNSERQKWLNVVEEIPT